MYVTVFLKCCIQSEMCPKTDIHLQRICADSSFFRAHVLYSCRSQCCCSPQTVLSKNWLGRAVSSELCGAVDVEDVTLQARSIILLWEQPLQKAEHRTGFCTSSGLA